MFKAIEIELNKYIETQAIISAALPDNDLRTQHILTYFSCNNVSREIRIIALYDLFRIQTFSENNLKLKLLQTYAQIKYNDYLLASLNHTSSSSSSSSSSSNLDLFKQYEKWQADYRDYRSIIAAFIRAVTYMENQKYEDAARVQPEPASLPLRWDTHTHTLFMFLSSSPLRGHSSEGTLLRGHS